MPDNLKIGAEVDLSQIGKLTTSSQEVAASVNTMSQAFEATGNAALDMAAKFLKSGMDVETVKGALIGLGSSAKQAAAIMAQLVPPVEQVGRESQVTATKVDGMTRALAMGATRMAAFELGAGQFGYALARVGSMSSALAPILASTFAVFGIVAFVDIVVKAAEAFEKWMHLGEETTHKMDDLTLSLSRQNDQLELTNIRIENQTAKLEHRPENFLALALAEDKLRADELSESLENALQKTVQLLEAGQGFGSALLGKGDVASVGKILEPLERELQLAILSGDKEAQKNVFLEAQKKLREELAAEQAKGTTEPAVGGEGMPFTGMVDQDAINNYKSALAGVQTQLDRIASTDKNRTDEATHAAAEKKAKAIEAANRDADQEAAANELMMRYAKKDLEEFTKLKRAELEEAEKVQKEQTRVLEIQAKAEAALRKSIDKEAADDYVTSWREAIKDQDEEFRSSQKKNELAMRDVSTKTSIATAGVSAGPFKNVAESKSIEDQSAIAARGMQQAKDAAASYNLELAAMAAAQAKVDVSTTVGQKEFQDLQNQIDSLRRQYDSANEASQRWANTLQKLGAEQKAISPTLYEGIGIAAQNAANASFSAFNSAFLRMATGGMSFVRVMQTAWTSMAESFITSILKMGEQFLVMEIKKKIAALTTAQVSTATSAETAAAEQVAAKTSNFAFAKLSASKAYSSLADIPIVGPALGAAAAAATFTLLMFERGGIVPAGLHEGEMVLPKNISTFVQTAAAGASGKAGAPGAPGSNRPINFNYHAHVSGISNDGIGEMLDAHGDAMFNFFQGKVRRMGVNI